VVAIGNPFFAAKSAPREVPKGRLFGMQIHRGDLKPLEIIGAGQFGAVYLATQSMRTCPGCQKQYAIDGHLTRCLEKCAPEKKDNPTHYPIIKKDVTRAVKMLKNVNVTDEKAFRAAKKEFFEEANVMLMFDHPNVTNIMGVAVQQAPWLYVIEYCLYGDVRGLLKGCLAKRIVLHAGEMVEMCLGMAKGMEHIAGLRLVHMDLAARNVLIGKDNEMKVADFGLTREIQPGEKMVVVKDKNIKLAIKWMSIEVLEKRHFSEQSDLWSCAITMWEVLAYGELPYKGRNNLETQKFIGKGSRMSKPKGCPDTLWTIVDRCWAQKPAARGTFTELVEKLTGELELNRPPSVRDIGAMLTDPAVDKRAKEEQAKVDIARKELVEASKVKREELVEEARVQKALYGARFQTEFCTQGCHWIPRMFASSEHAFLKRTCV
jgi:serine/threonine protein kinase